MTGSIITDLAHAFLHLNVNLQAVTYALANPQDAKFEVEALINWMEIACAKHECSLMSSERENLISSGNTAPRFAFRSMQLPFDSPQYASPVIPEADSYKKARRELALVFQAANIKPGDYELEDAKRKIDIARDRYRELIHAKLERLSKLDLLKFCIYQMDELVAQNWQEKQKLKLSRTHEVDYDRGASLAETLKNTVKETRNCRYLLEHTLSSDLRGDTHLDRKIFADILANVDWLFVLYSASDIIHNDLEATGLKLNDDFIPKIYYSSHCDDREKTYSTELANSKLGIGVSDNDPVTIEPLHDFFKDKLDVAFLHDLGFSFSHLVGGLDLLATWQSYKKFEKPAFRYEASIEEVADAFVQRVPDILQEQALALIKFLTLDAASIRKLLGKESLESDVPVWEHNKRGHRFTIRPLVPLENKLSWGAALAFKSSVIWMGSIFEGYLPADFPWPCIKKEVRGIKHYLEKQLEEKSAEICRRFFPYVEKGIDFKRRFPSDNFDDVGDYDVLAYDNQSNAWVIVECKYNQPPFCIKDARRLRDRIFGSSDSREQFAKIEKRRRFLRANHQQLATLLHWPSSSSLDPNVMEVYSCINIYWYMRNPPYDVPTQFVQVDGLDLFLEKHFSRA